LNLFGNDESFHEAYSKESSPTGNHAPSIDGDMAAERDRELGHLRQRVIICTVIFGTRSA
jgi:hypothetical protein